MGYCKTYSGSWSYRSRYCTVVNSELNSPICYDYDIGFRIIKYCKHAWIYILWRWLEQLQLEMSLCESLCLWTEELLFHWGLSYYKISIMNNYRVKRGGSWINFAGYCRTASRDFNHPDYRSYRMGFRIVKYQLWNIYNAIMVARGLTILSLHIASTIVTTFQASVTTI